MCAALHYANLQQSPDKCKSTGAEDTIWCAMTSRQNITNKNNATHSYSEHGIKLNHPPTTKSFLFMFL